MTEENTIKFLLVDDLPENLLSLEALLKREGLTLLTARSGREALELLLEHEIALALLDVQMPGMDGFELAELMRGSQRTKDIPIIFLTAGLADANRKFRGYEAGAVDFLQKPIEADILKSKARVFFELYQQRQLLSYQRDELQRQAEALKQSDRQKDIFLATLAHELRNPLAPIRNGLEIFKTSPEKAIANKIDDMMERQIIHLVRLIDDLLDVSRVSEGKINLKRETITLQDVMQSAVESSLPLIKMRQHEFAMTVPIEELWVDGDLTRLAQVVSNILNNAAKYTPIGGQITLDVSVVDYMAQIVVTDNGSGIRAEMLPKIFGLFTQIDRNLESAQGGLGIGLALVKHLVDMHHGTISATSPGLDMGSTFTVMLPLSDDKGVQKNAPKNDEITIPELNILVVDDNIESAKTIGWMLDLMGAQSEVTYSGTEALAFAKRLLPDVILLDIGLPGMSGYDVCRELRQDPKFKNTLMIAQSGWGREADIIESKKAGFDHHLIKPISFDMLKDILANPEKANWRASTSSLKCKAL